MGDFCHNAYNNAFKDQTGKPFFFEVVFKKPCHLMDRQNASVTYIILKLIYSHCQLKLSDIMYK